jgi:hypothetical protein
MLEAGHQALGEAVERWAGGLFRSRIMRSRALSGVNGAPYRREKKEELNEQSGSLVMTCTHRTNLGQRWLRPRKRRGTTACPEKAQSVEAIYGAAGQGKTCMAKAILPEPQFAATYTASGAAQWLTRRFGRSESAMFILSASRSSDVERPGLPARPTHPLYGGASERTGRLNTSQPPLAEMRDRLNRTALPDLHGDGAAIVLKCPV